MKPTLLFLIPASVFLSVGCAPKKPSAPHVSADPQTAHIAAAEGVASVGSAATAPIANNAPAVLPVIGPAPAWQLKDLDGHPVSAADFRGKVVVLDFWATWCPPCRAEIPGYVTLYQKYKDRLVVVGVSVDEGGPNVVRSFVQKFGVTYPVVMSDAGVESAFGGFEAIPTTFLIDQKGQIRDKKVGAEPTEEYEQKIKSLLD